MMKPIKNWSPSRWPSRLTTALAVLAVTGAVWAFYGAATGQRLPVPGTCCAQPVGAEWRVEWRGSDRYMRNANGWHTWSPRSEWVRLHPAIAQRLGLE
jgi:hypothetical protein